MSAANADKAPAQIAAATPETTTDTLLDSKVAEMKLEDKKPDDAATSSIAPAEQPAEAKVVEEKPTEQQPIANEEAVKDQTPAEAATTGVEKPTKEEPTEEQPAAAARAQATEESATAKPTETTSVASATAPAAAPDAAEPAETTKSTTSAPTATPIQTLWATVKAQSHPEIWGVVLADPETHVPTQIVLQKYLNANDSDVAKAKDQLAKTLAWRAEKKPLELAKKVFSRDKFGSLGYVTSYGGKADGAAEDEAPIVDPEAHEVFTWNIYGCVKDFAATFTPLDDFIEWRVALMELALESLDIAHATKPITADEDSYKIYQVHDYRSVSFLRQSPHVKAASTKTIDVMAQNYPELLKEKFFVNVPAIMGFIYSFIKVFVAPKTIKKFHPMANGANMAREFAQSKVAGLGDMLPVEYGGKGAELKAQGRETTLG